MSNCIFCGADLEEDAKFCANCGKPAAEEAAAEEIVEAAVTEEVAAEEAAAEETAETAVPEEAAAEEIAAEPDAALEVIIEEAACEEAEAAEDTEASEEEEPKKRSGWTWVTTLVVVIAGVIVLGLVGYYSYTQGWLNPVINIFREKNSCELGDISKIEVLESEITADEETLNGYVESLLSDYASNTGVMPELTDEWIRENSLQLAGKQLETVDEFKQFAREDLEGYYLGSAMMGYIDSKVTVKTYDAVKLEELHKYCMADLNTVAAQYGITADQYAAYLDYESADALATEEAQGYLKRAMTFDKIIETEKLDYSEEILNADLEEYLKTYGYDAMYTLDQFKENVGEEWIYLYENLQVKYDFVIDALKDRVEIIPDLNQE